MSFAQGRLDATEASLVPTQPFMINVHVPSDDDELDRMDRHWHAAIELVEEGSGGASDADDGAARDD